MINKKDVLILLFAFFTFSLLTNRTYGQFEPHPDLNWKTIETAHFYVHFHEGTERTANTTAKIAEEIYGPITTLYGFEPDDKTSLIISDVSDIANGATDFF